MTERPDKPGRQIVVGTDGSTSALRAVRWAAREAALRDRDLVIVNTYLWPVSGYPDGLIMTNDLREAMSGQSTEVLRDALQQAQTVAPAVSASVVSTIGGAQPVLRDWSRRAELVVLGSRGLGGFTGLLVGSTAVGLASRAACPVVVVRGDREPLTGPVVVGVDGTPISEAAIAFAFEEAALRRAPLSAVHAWHETAFDVALHTSLTAEFWESMTERSAELIAERLAGWREKYPDVVVTTESRGIGAAELLVRHAAGAQLVVVGSRGRGGFRGLTLGSTSQALIRHANSPVVVVRSDTIETI